jgi:hypothetical protein
MKGKKDRFIREIDWKSLYYGPAIVALITFLFFFWMYGVRILNPLYTDWMMLGGDLTQHYLGWQAFANETWMFPLGGLRTLSAPMTTSVIFTDSIPLMAIPCKLIAHLIKVPFQYFGLWGLLCYEAQALIAYRILSYYTENRVNAVLGGLLSLLNPYYLTYMFRHTALSSHFILLLALELCLTPKKFEEKRRFLMRCALLGLIASAVHIYLLLMVGIILAAYCFADFVVHRRFWRNAIGMGGFLGTSLLTVYMLGGFLQQSDTYEGGGLGYYSFNLNGFWNPWGWSRILPELPRVYPKQGVAYLGMGVFLLLLVACVGFFVRRRKKAIRKCLVSVISLVLTFLVSLGFAVTYQITYGDRILRTFSVPKRIEELWGIFRVTSRVAQVCVYALMLSALIMVLRSLSPKIVTAVVFAVLCLQAFDLSEGLLSARKGETFGNVTYENTLSELEVMQVLAECPEYRRLVLASDLGMGTPTYDPDTLYMLADWTIKNGKTQSNFYFARLLGAEMAYKTQEMLEAGDSTDVFVFFPGNYFLAKDRPFHFYLAGDLLIGTRDPLEGVDEIPLKITEFNLMPAAGEYLDLAEDDESGRLIHYGGTSYGPYIELPAATYEVDVFGNLIANASISFTADRGQTEITDQSEIIAAYRVFHRFVLMEPVEDFEMVVRNQQTVDCKLEYVTLYRLDGLE